MARTKDTVKRNYPLPVYNFRVDVAGVTLSFAEISGIQVEYEALTYRHGLSFSEGEDITTFSFDSFIPVTLKRGMILGREALYLHTWLRGGEPRRLDVHLCDETGTALLGWRIARAVPVKLEAPGFDAGSNDAAVETVELRARGISLIEH